MNRKPGFALHSALIAMLLMLLTLLPSSAAYAQWTGEGILVTDNLHYEQRVVHDGQGGAWIVWVQLPSVERKVLVQHYNSDGYVTLQPGGVHVIEDTTSCLGFWFDAFSSDNGGVIVVFHDETIDPDSGFGFYAQKFNLAGERLFGPEGAVVLNPTGYQSFKRACSDGMGGAWLYYNTGFADESIYICGINADGTQKVEEGIYLGEDTSDFPIFRAGMCHDEEGGVFVAWAEHPGQNPPYRIIYKHINADGDLEFPDPRTVFENELGFSYQLDIVPDSEGGLYFSSTVNRVYWILQRMSAEGDHPWGIEGLCRREGEQLDMFISSPAVMEDRIFITSAATMSHSGTYLIGAMADNGDPAFDGEYSVNIDSTVYTQVSYPVLTIPTLDGCHAYVLHKTSGDVPDAQSHRHIRIHYVDFEGNDLWEDNPLWIFAPDVILWGEQVGYMYAITTPSDELIFSAHWMGHVGNDFIEVLHLFKVNPDGTVEGAEQSVSESSKSSSPSTFTLLGAFPNPFNGTIHLKVQVYEPGPVQLTVYNLQGQIVDCFNYIATCGDTIIPWSPSSSLASGVYLIQLSNRNQSSLVTKIILLR